MTSFCRFLTSARSIRAIACFTGLTGRISGILNGPQRFIPHVFRNVFTPVPNFFSKNATQNESSAFSESASFTIIKEMLGGELFLTENSIKYNSPLGRRTDYVMLIEDSRIAVQVARAYRGPYYRYTQDDAILLVGKKIQCIIESNLNVHNDHLWSAHILHLLAPSLENADMLHDAIAIYQEAINYNSITVIITVIDPEANPRLF